MRLNKRRSLLSTIVPAIAASLALGNTVAQGGHHGHHRHQADCECQNVHAPTVPCDPCQGAPIADPTQMVDPSAVPEAMAAPMDIQPMDTGATSDFNDFDLSTGLTSNFGGGGGSSLAFSESTVAPGYIESAPIQTRVRLRYDNMQGANDPTRAQFLYPTIGQLGGEGPSVGIGIGADEVDLEQVSTYIEIALRERLSVFIDVPVRWISPLDLGNGPGTEAGASDISTGIRWGLINCPDEHLTFQLRTTLPTGAPLQALGTGTTTMDVGLLYDQRLTDRTTIYGELNDWFSLDATALTDPSIPASLRSQDANVLRLGGGIGYDLLRCGSRCDQRKLTVLAEVVTWVVLDGISTDLVASGTPGDDVRDATGDTIVNGKYGARYTHDDHSIYVGYGHNWTSDRWYSDLFRLEYQRLF